MEHAPFPWAAVRSPSFHCARHRGRCRTLAVSCTRKGNIELVSRHLGHKIIETNRRDDEIKRGLTLKYPTRS